MNTKKITLILITIAFALVVVFSGVGLFSIRKVSVDFAVSDDENGKIDASAVQEGLDQFKDKNLLFFKEEQVYDFLKDNHYIEVVDVSKKYPNVLNVKIRERREVYYIEYEDKVFITNEDGFVVSSIDKNAFSGNVSKRDQIMLTLIDKPVSIIDARPGNYIKTNNDELVSQVFALAKTVRLTDCIKSIEVIKVDGENIEYNVFFNSYTGVRICVEDFLVMGKEKSEKAFDYYNNEISDYQKTFGEIFSLLTYKNEFSVVYRPETTVKATD